MKQYIISLFLLCSCSFISKEQSQDILRGLQCAPKLDVTIQLVEDVRAVVKEKKFTWNAENQDLVQRFIKAYLEYDECIRGQTDTQ